jgi:hypothetical protein
MKKFSLVLAFCLGLVSLSFAQKLKLNSGELAFLKGQSTINVQYDYADMSVGKYDREEDYVTDKVNDYNKKEAGKGDEWKKNWVADRTERYEPKFEELMNKELEKNGVKFGNYPDAEYTLILRTTFTEPGFNVGVARKNAYTDLEAVFIPTGSTKEMAAISIENSPGRGGMGYDFDSGFRIQESYAKAGKELAQFLKKKAL